MQKRTALTGGAGGGAEGLAHLLLQLLHLLAHLPGPGLQLPLQSVEHRVLRAQPEGSEVRG